MTDKISQIARRIDSSIAAQAKLASQYESEIVLSAMRLADDLAEATGESSMKSATAVVGFKEAIDAQIGNLAAAAVTKALGRPPENSAPIRFADASVFRKFLGEAVKTVALDAHGRILHEQEERRKAKRS